MTISDTSSDTRPPAPVSRRRGVSAGYFAVCLAVPLLAVRMELYGYARAVHFSWHGQHWELLIALLLYLQAITLLVAPLCIAAILSYCGFRRTAHAVFIIGATLALSWFVGDLVVFQTGGHHAEYYAGLVFTPAIADVGGFGTIARQVGLLVGVVGLLVGLCTALCIWLTAPLERRRGSLNAIVSLACVSVYMVCFFLPRPLLRSAGLPFSLEDLELNGGAGWTTQANPPFNSESFSVSLRKEMAPFLEQHHGALFEPQPIDSTLKIEGSHLPNVFLIVVESLRADTLNAEVMPRVSRWAQGGLRLMTHRSGGNMSEYGLFSLLYGRSSAHIDTTVAAKLVPQMCVTLKRSGYHTTFIPSIGSASFKRVTYLNFGGFDDIPPGDRMDPSPSSLHLDWAPADINSFAIATGLLNRRAEGPQFVVVFTASTHYPYRFPEGERQWADGPEKDRAPDLTDPVTPRVMRARYHNAAAFTDRLIGEAIDKLDPRENIIIVAGDHGESLLEDGSMTHGARVSEVETRVPCVMVGPGFAPAQIHEWTTHSDVLPTLLHALAGHAVQISGCQGDDVLDPGFRRNFCLMPACIVKEPGHTLLLEEPEERVGIRLLAEQPYLQVLGPVDTNGNFEPNVHLINADAPRWAASLREALEPWLRGSR